MLCSELLHTARLCRCAVWLCVCARVAATGRETHFPGSASLVDETDFDIFIVDGFTDKRARVRDFAMFISHLVGHDYNSCRVSIQGYAFRCLHRTLLTLFNFYSGDECSCVTVT